MTSRIALTLIVAVSALGLAGCAGFNPIGGVLSQEDTANDLAAKSALSTAVMAVETFAISNENVYPTSVADLAEFGYVPTEGVGELQLLSGTGSYCLDAVSASGRSFKVVSGTPVAEGECSTADLG